MSEGPALSSEVGRYLCDLFALELDDSLLEVLTPDVELVHLHGGEILMSEGEAADSMYAVISGRLRTFVTLPDGSAQAIGEVGVGERVGEMALITDDPRSATVRATRDTDLIRISRSAFERLIAERPGALLDMVREIVDRLSRLMHSAPPESPIKTVALLPIDDVVPIGAVASRLTEALAKIGKVLRLDRDRFDMELGSGAAELTADAGARSREIAAWQSDQEASHRFVLYQADATPTPWTIRCLRQADRILLVGSSRGSPNAGAADQALEAAAHGGLLASQELVLVHESRASEPRGTRRWLRDRDIVRHAHLAINGGRDLDRLARLLAGQGVGLVLGGGGARGFAHIGVIRALEEAGIPIDAIGGVSMGAIVAAQYAMGFSPEEMVRRNTVGIVENKLNRDITLPIVSLSSGRRFERTLRSFFGSTQIEDLWLPFLCVSCNLTTGATVVHRHGDLVRAVAASNAAPGILPPVPDRGDLLVDGGIVNNEPGDIMKRFSGGPVIVVNVSATQDLSVDPSYDRLPSPWAILGHRFGPLQEPIEHPDIASLLMRSIMVGSRHKSEAVEQAADFYLRPPVDRFRVDDYSKIGEIADVGYRHAQQAVAAWSGLHATRE